ncbi:integrase/recombinase XerD [Dysgonomonas sp. PFB1-18]|uniref:site-specific integrase n=1 Tax=unclassified Dysgonomonas TaxID=2630389 RepID=UPI0024746555|nr:MULTISPECIES: site-specific integrase [unclassified Dysgonomonas]MDH6310733.1 integrase/recombinase XerD [Dysgonomonas sp. PF1-14]MDH6340583.1 integrase/recombinase XerD [Dysgonomonas sp. PF1-16]MDH6382160.1 integrase/recombinase XerD [Dysgonomonas sp. PFB1-18]MDH6399504.1 integrase/recombinase XerD [Dysgonomonas sp. PF1-23]
MFKYTKDGVSVLTVLDTRRTKQSGLFPIKVQVVYNRKQKYYSTGKELSLNEWEIIAETKSKKLISIRADIKNSFDKVEDAVRTLVENGNFSFDALNIYLGKHVGDTLNMAFETKIKGLIESGSIGNSDVYTCAYNYLQKYAGNNLPFESVTIDWLKRYEKAMLEEGKSYTTISIYIRCVRALFNDAKSIGIIKEAQYPFGRGKYEVPSGKGRKLALNLNQIKQIITYTDGSEATERYRDLWFFSYLCNGINVNDLLKLKFSNVDGDEIHFYRSKTIHTTKDKKEIEALLTPEMRLIIDKWGNSDQNPNNYIFPFLTGEETPLEQKRKIQDVTHRINKRLKKIGEAIGISGLSTYTARHSYASVLKRSGANIAYISESLGHSDLKTTENYLASFEKEERIKNAAFLTNFED